MTSVYRMAIIPVYSLSLALVWMMVVGTLVSCSTRAEKQRTLTPDDLLRINKIGDVLGGVAISPDGKTVAYVQQCSHDHRYLSYWDKRRTDIWLAPTALAGGVTPRNLTHGDAGGRDYWMPQWSPDGTRIALLSTDTDDDQIHLRMWEKTTGRLKKLSVLGVPYYLVAGYDPPFAWVDNERLVAVLEPKGVDSRVFPRKTAASAVRGWQKAWAGQEATASVLDSGMPVDLSYRSQRQLVTFDVSGKVELLVSTANIQGVQVSPNGQYIAFLKQVDTLSPDPEEQLKFLLGTTRLGGYYDTGDRARFQLSVIDTHGGVRVAVAKDSPLVQPGSFHWSSDGRHFAFVGVKKEGGPFLTFRGSVEGSIDRVVLPDNVDPQGLLWANERLIVSAANLSESKTPRVDWWLTFPGETARNLTAKLRTAPSTLWPDTTGESVSGLADGRLWRFNFGSGQWQDLMATLETSASAITWPNSGAAGFFYGARRAGWSRLIVSASRGRFIEYYRVEVASGTVTRMRVPSENAKLEAYSPETDIAIFTANEHAGSFLTLVRGEKSRILVETNTFLQGVAEGERQMITYRSLDGQDLKAWILLPPQYQVGKRYPLVTWVYAGNVYKDRLPSVLADINSGNLLNLNLLTARGYVVLVPSMPLPPSGQVSDVYMELTKGVMPSVDRTVELGIGDPNRLAVMGHSFGGFSTFGLVTQTNRFKAAIAIAGISDFISDYGTFSVGSRYEPYSQENLYLPAGTESGWGHMGSPLWKDWSRYQRNSPLSYIDRVQTPLLIIHGDLDPVVPIEQSEEFFTALYRQGKRARFIRYWGEEHVLDSPANIRDFWNQAYAWLDEFCNISRDASGNLVFDGDHVKSRNGASPLKPEDFARFNEMELKSRPWIEKTEGRKQ